MTPRLDEQLDRYGNYLDSVLVEVEPEQAIDRAMSRSPRPLAEDPAVPTWRRGLVVAMGTAAAVLAIVGAIFLFGGPLADEESPVVTEPSPTVDEPVELVPTDAHLLTDPVGYQFAARESSGVVWLGGYEGQVARLDPVTGETQVWTMRDDATFGPGVQGLAPAREGGVWMILSDNSLRWFDGAHFRKAVAAPVMMSDRDDVGMVVEAADGTLLASTAEGGVFRWDGSSWSEIDQARGADGAGALAVAADGTMWVGNDNVGGISRHDGVSWTAYSGDDAAVLAGPVLTIDPLADGTVLVGTESGVALFDGAGWSEWTSAEIGLRGNISATVGADGTVWAAGGSESNGAVGVASFDGDGWSQYGPDHGLPGETRWFIAVPVATEDGVFVTTGAGVYQLGGERWTRVVPVEEQALPAEPPAALAGVRDVRASGGLLWAWGENQIWHYRDGAWEYYAPIAEAPWDIAYDGSTLWAINEGLVYLDGEEWHRPAAAPTQVWRIDADANAGVLWVSTGDELYRLDGEEMTNVGFPLNWPPQSDGDPHGHVGDIGVSTDGRVWAAGFYGYTPSLGSVAVYDDESGSWETVRLGHNDELMPAAALAITPDGGVWVMLNDWPKDWVESTAPSPGWALAYRDPATGDWKVYDEDLPDAYPLAMAATNDGVWLAQGSALAEGTRPIAGLFHFDGVTWTHHPSSEVRGLAAASDGTVWFVTETGVLRQVER